MATVGGIKQNAILSSKNVEIALILSAFMALVISRIKRIIIAITEPGKGNGRAAE